MCSHPFSGYPACPPTFMRRSSVLFRIEHPAPLTGGTLTGRTTINKVREDTNSIAFSIAGRIRNNDGAVEPDILLKSYQRNEADTQPDYLAYYGSGGGANEVLNRTTAQDEFADKTIVDDALEVQAAIQEQQETQAGELVSLQNQSA